MKIKNTELEIIQGKAGRPAVEDIENVSEDSVRQAMRDALKQSKEGNGKTIAFSALGCGKDGLPVVGSAKIMTQEVLRFLKFENSSLEKIIFCVEDQKMYDQFQQTVSGYVTHIQDTLGEGPYATVDIIIELDEGIILIERSNPPYGWALPGGFVDYGESLESCARRESKEETNMDLEGLRQFHTYSDPDRDPRFHTISTVFIAKGKGKPQFGDDAKGLKVVAYGELTKLNYAFDHNKIIEDYLKQR